MVLLLLPVYIAASLKMQRSYDRMDEIAAMGELRSVRAHITKKEIKNEKYRYYVKVEGEKNVPAGLGGERGVLTSDEYDLPADCRIVFDGSLMELSPAQNEGGFDAKKYYAAKGVTFYCGIEAVRVTDEGFFLYELLWRIRSAAAAFFDMTLPGEESGLMSAMALGEKGDLDAYVSELFSEAGLSHLLAVSGLHISIVGMGLVRLLRALGMKHKPAVVLSLLAVACYGFMTGLSTSTIRAVLMFCIMTGAEVIDEAYDVGSAAALSAVIILLGAPTALFDVGFLFSFGAVFGIVFVADPLRKKYEALRRGRFFDMASPPKLSMAERLISALIFGAGIQLFTLPIIAISYHGFSPYVIILNILLLPFMGLLIGWGLICGLVGAGFSLVIGAGPVGAVGGFLMLPCHCILYIYEMVCDLMLRLPRASLVVGQPKLWQVAVYYCLLGLGMYLVESCPLGGRVYRAHENMALVIREEIKKRRRFLMIPGMLFVICLFVIFSDFSHETEIDMISVGQGDGICILSREGEVFMVDGGSTSEDELARYTLKPYFKYKGIDRVSYWFVTHMDEDHYNGLFALLEDDFSVDAVVLAKAVEKNEAYYELIDLCDKHDTEIYYMKTGDSCGTDTLKFTCLFPEDPSGFSGTNENSLCLRLDYGDFNMIFTGDMGSEQEEAVLDDGRWDEVDIGISAGAELSGRQDRVDLSDGVDLNRKSDEVDVSGRSAGVDGFGGDRKVDIEILKSAHHGSKNSNCTSWLQALSPRLCIISAGKNNRYHHPSPDTISRLDDLGIPHMCTIDYGEIRILPEKDGRFMVETLMN